MNDEQKFAAIETLLPVIEQYYNTGQAILPADMGILLKEVYEKYLFTGGTMNLGCPSCVKYGLDVVYSYYKREHPKYLQSLVVTESSKLIDQEPVEELKIKPTPKKKSNGRK